MVTTPWHQWPYNFTDINGLPGQNVTGIGSYFNYLNVAGVNGMMGYIFLILIGFVAFITLKSMTTIEKAFASTMFVLTLISILLIRIEWIGFHILIPIIIVMVVSVLLARSESNKYGL